MFSQDPELDGPPFSSSVLDLFMGEVRWVMQGKQAAACCTCCSLSLYVVITITYLVRVLLQNSMLLLMLMLLLSLLFHRQWRHSSILVWSAASMATEECLVCHKCALTHIHTENLFSLNSSSLLNYLYSSWYSDICAVHPMLGLSHHPLSHFPYLMARFVFLSKYLFLFCSSCLLVSPSCESSALFCTARDWIFIQQTRAVKPQEDSMFKHCHNSSSLSTLARHLLKLTNALLAGPFTFACNWEMAMQLVKTD